MNWTHDKPAPRRSFRAPLIREQTGAEALAQPAEDRATEWQRDEKTGLYLPDGARKSKQPAGFMPS